MPRGSPVCMLVVCVVLMNAASTAHAQQAIGLRPSLVEDASTVDSAPLPDDARNVDDSLAPPGAPEEPAGPDARFVESAEIAPPPTGGIPQVPRTIDELEVAAPTIGAYDALGLRLGAFRAYPVVEVTGVVTDNVEQSAFDRQADIGLRIAPELRLQSDWVRHSASLDANGELIFYAVDADFNERSANVIGNVLLDVRRSTTWETTGTYGLTQTSPSSSEVPDSASSPRTDQDFALTTRLSHRMGRLVGRISAGVRYLLFDDVTLTGGGQEDNSDRNYLEPSAEFRLSYEHKPAIRPFAEIRYQPRIHDRTVDRSGLRRDSHGGTIAAGVEFDLSQIWSGEVALRYDIRDFDDATLGTVHSGGVDANVVWRPSQLTTVRLTTSSELDESASAGISAVRNYFGTLVIEHALRENIIISGTGGLAFNDFIGSGQDELTFDAGIGVSYLLSRQAEVLARYGFSKFETFKSDDDYIENQFTAGFRFKL